MDENRITGEAKKFAGKVEGAVGDLAGDQKMQAKGEAAELKGTAENFVGQAKDSVRGFADQASSVAKDVLEKGRKSYPDAERAYRQGAEAVGEYAKASPLAGLLTAGAAGFLIGWLLNRRD